jgi:hypothetical protein
MLKPSQLDVVAVPNTTWFLTIQPPISTSGMASAAPACRQVALRATRSSASTASTHSGLNRLRASAVSVTRPAVASSQPVVGVSR